MMTRKTSRTKLVKRSPKGHFSSRPRVRSSSGENVTNTTLKESWMPALQHILDVRFDSLADATEALLNIVIQRMRWHDSEDTKGFLRDLIASDPELKEILAALLKVKSDRSL